MKKLHFKYNNDIIDFTNTKKAIKIAKNFIKELEDKK